MAAWNLPGETCSCLLSKLYKIEQSSSSLTGRLPAGGKLQRGHGLAVEHPPFDPYDCANTLFHPGTLRPGSHMSGLFFAQQEERTELLRKRPAISPQESSGTLYRIVIESSEHSALSISIAWRESAQARCPSFFKRRLSATRLSTIAQTVSMPTAKVAADLVVSEFLSALVRLTRHEAGERRRGYRNEAVQ